MLTSDQLITKTRTIGSPRISPDGKHIVYILGYIEAESPRSSLWMMNADGSENRQITFQAEKVGWPAWSPDSATIAFVASYDGKHHLSTLALDGGEARPLSEHVESPAGLAWSPDGRTIAYTMRVNPDANDEDSATPPVRVTRRLDYKQDGKGYLNNARDQLFVVDVESGTTRQLTSEYKDHAFPQWSPDGDRIIVTVSDRNGMRDVMHIIPVAGGDPKEIGWPEGTIGLYSWSPDGSQILFTGYPTNSPQHEFYRYVVADDAVVPSTVGLDFDPESGYPTASSPSWPIWIDDDKVVVNAGFQGMTSLFGLDVTDGVDVQITIWEATHSGLSVDDAHTTIVQTASSPAYPSRLVKVDLHTHEVTTLLDPNKDLLPLEELANVEYITVERGDDRIDAWVYLPPNLDLEKRYPVVLDIHGGPHNRHGFTWNAMAHFLASHGYIVVAPNPRGSSSYGREWAEAVWGDWGGEDWQDILAVLDFVLDRDYADAQRCAIFGYSYGGYMASWAVGHTDRFKTAIVGAPVYNFDSFAGTSDIGHCWTEIQWGGNIFDPAQKSKIMEQSPSTYIHKDSTPTLILQGEADDRCPVGQAEELFVALSKVGVETELVRYPGCSHLMRGSGPVPYRIDFNERVLAWLDAHV
ncbi:MAG: S9 family peptidase [Thermomicrobiales bacterium]|nr:S9 family peptidase [Thermomicrobiales bacterium]